ncbi:MAG TPA: hypothetical protein VFI11_07250 [Anaerolineales bacterium]|nr:hypothetical protein [Anaerolineales bacterium]
MNDEPDVNSTTLAETENFVAWSSLEPDGETTYHLELGLVTVHFFHEEWVELLALLQDLEPPDRR